VRVLRQAWPYVRPHARLFAAAVLALLAGTALDLLKPWPLKLIVDGAASGALGPRLIAGAALLALLAYGGQAAAAALENYLHIAAGERTVLGFRAALFDHLVRASLRAHDRARPGDWLQRVTTHSYAVWELVRVFAFGWTGSAVALVAALAVLVRMDLALAGATLAVLPLLFAVTLSYARRARAATADHQAREARVWDAAQRALIGVRLIRAFGREEQESSRFRDALRGSLLARSHVARTDALFSLRVGLVTALGAAVVLAFGALRLRAGVISPGDLVVFLVYLWGFYGPVTGLVYLPGSVQAAVNAFGRALEIFSTTPDVPERPGASPLRSAAGAIELRDVAIAYDGRPALDRVSLRVEPGQMLAIVGPTGGGKSTLASLIPRFLDPDAGAVLLDGRDLRDLKLKDLRACVAFMPQETMLLAATVRENIGYGRPGASAVEIGQAARLAAADRFIRTLPHAYDTEVGEQGALLSGGERQRIALARAFLKEAPVLVLDEPTSALDPETETAVFEALRGPLRAKAVLLITHRARAALRADWVAVLEAGRVVEQGAPDALVRQGGALSRLLSAAEAS
jgi:ABC-type multidrug transport system fused ATPase/permease subunit